MALRRRDAPATDVRDIAIGSVIIIFTSHYSRIGRRNIMPKTTPEMNKKFTDYLAALVARDVAVIEKDGSDDEIMGYIAFHSEGPVNWSLREAVDYIRPMKPSAIPTFEPVGYYEGDFAWFVGMPKGILPDGTEVVVRVTMIMRRVGDDWKTVHWHVSEPVDRSKELQG
jgi:ketosteroid isomerase-like protein